MTAMDSQISCNLAFSYVLEMLSPTILSYVPIKKTPAHNP